MRRALIALALAATFGHAAGQACQSELQAALPGPGATPGQVAAALFAEVVRRVEPALPAIRGGDGPVADAGAAADAVTYLHRRGLLPAGWSPVTHTPADWDAMLRGFVTGYRVDPIDATGADTIAMLREAARVLAAVGAAVRPLPIFAVDEDGHLTLFVVIWNWTPSPRLLVFRPSDGVMLSGNGDRADAAVLLSAMGSCAVRFGPYAYAREDVALRLFVDRGGESTLRVLGVDPPTASLADAYVGEDVVAMLTYRHPDAAGVTVYSASIEGSSPSLGDAIYILAHVRTNAGLGEVRRALTLP